jgi:hypothetical protein
MGNTVQRRADRGWIVLGEDGRYVNLGRASDPTEEEILKCETALVTQGLSGWLAVMEGNAHTGPAPRLMEVRPLGSPSVTFDAAAQTCVAAILEMRQELDD